MSYYKLISGSTFVGIANQYDFRKFQHKHSVILACREDTAQYVQCNGLLYRADWMVPTTTDEIAYETVDIVRIEKDEYDILYEAVEQGKDIVVEPGHTEPDIEKPVVDPNTEVTVEFVKSSKIAELSAICNKLIENGVDVVLSDGESYHFSLTTQDQLNLITLQSMVVAGETMIPYHADDELCRYYSVADITLVMNAATAHKTYHVTYFNSLKEYVSALDSIADISAITYGVIIPDEYQSDILKQMIATMSGGVA